MPGQKKEYEAGMKIIYDPESKRVIVNFRGRVQVLPGIYDSESAALNDGEQHCRHLGWQPRHGNDVRPRVQSPWHR